jgi:hypothetical protein
MILSPRFVVLVPSSVTVLMIVALLKGHRRLPYAPQSIQNPVSLGLGKGAAEDFVEISGDSFESMSVVWGTFCVLEQLANSPLVETGELLGEHVWDEELLRESRGEFVFAHVRFSDPGPTYYSLTHALAFQHADFRQLLYDTALSCGATIRLNTTITAVEPDACRVRLSTGEVLEADVIVGADGSSGLSRRLFDQGESIHRMNMYRFVFLFNCWPSFLERTSPSFVIARRYPKNSLCRMKTFLSFTIEFWYDR